MPNRREFITTSAAVAAAPFIATSVTRAAAEKSRKKLGFAVCGLGNLSEHQIMPALAKTRNCRLTGLVTGTPEKRKKFGSLYDIPEHSIYSYDDMHRMADNPDIDVVYVVTPNALMPNIRSRPQRRASMCSARSPWRFPRSGVNR